MIVNGVTDELESRIKIQSEAFSDVYDVLSEVGRGKYAVVKRCMHRSSGIDYAAKFLHKRRRGRDCRHEALHEVHMLQLTKSHPRIVELVEVYETRHDFVIVTEFIKGGELFEFIEAEGRVDEDVTVRLLRQVLEGVQFLHSHNILHMDIKPQNILLTNALPDGDIKLCDFGLARSFNSGDDVVEIVGTLDYVAPEVLDYVSLDSACDMWSVGVLAYVMLTGCAPFAGSSKQETMLNISQVNLDFPDDLFSSISTDAVNFIRGLLTKKTKDRMTAAECWEHKWLKEPDDVPSPAVQPSVPDASPAVQPSVPDSLPLVPLCRVPSVSYSPSGQRRALASALADDDESDDTLSLREPAKKCRCDVDLEQDLVDRPSADSSEDKENCVDVEKRHSSTSSKRDSALSAETLTLCSSPSTAAVAKTLIAGAGVDISVA